MTNQEQLKELKTEQVRSKQDIGIAAHLCRNYMYNPPLGKELEKWINSDWCTADFLTDLVKFGKVDEPIRMPVAFIMISQLAPKDKVINSRTKIDLEVTCFATAPYFDEEIAVEWADYRIRRALEYIARSERILFPVDERNVPLQLALRDAGYKVLLPERDSEKLIFTK
jgi:hypothetical protein